MAQYDGKVKASEIASRLTGFSTPFFGLSWEPAVSDRSVAKRVVTFLEDRRVLYYSSALEEPDRCVDSVLEIRQLMTEVIGRGGIGAELEGSLRLVRRHCVRFLDQVQEMFNQAPGFARGRRFLFRDPALAWEDFRFATALGELRSGVGLQVGLIAAAFDLDVEDGLGTQIPPIEGE